jgi:hypothetical protein
MSKFGEWELTADQNKRIASFGIPEKQIIWANANYRGREAEGLLKDISRHLRWFEIALVSLAGMAPLLRYISAQTTPETILYRPFFLVEDGATLLALFLSAIISRRALRFHRAQRLHTSQRVQIAIRLFAGPNESPTYRGRKQRAIMRAMISSFLFWFTLPVRAFEAQFFDNLIEMRAQQWRWILVSSLVVSAFLLWGALPLSQAATLNQFTTRPAYWPLYEASTTNFNDVRGVELGCYQTNSEDNGDKYKGIYRAQLANQEQTDLFDWFPTRGELIDTIVEVDAELVTEDVVFYRTKWNERCVNHHAGDSRYQTLLHMDERLPRWRGSNPATTRFDDP